MHYFIRSDKDEDSFGLVFKTSSDIVLAVIIT